jgi:hypothetical protein
MEPSLINCQDLETIEMTGDEIEDLNHELFVVDPKLKNIILNRRF